MLTKQSAVSLSLPIFFKGLAAGGANILSSEKEVRRSALHIVGDVTQVGHQVWAGGGGGGEGAEGVGGGQGFQDVIHGGIEFDDRSKGLC